MCGSQGVTPSSQERVGTRWVFRVAQLAAPPCFCVPGTTDTSSPELMVLGLYLLASVSFPLGGKNGKLSLGFLSDGDNTAGALPSLRTVWTTWPQGPLGEPVLGSQLAPTPPRHQSLSAARRAGKQHASARRGAAEGPLHTMSPVRHRPPAHFLLLATWGQLPTPSTAPPRDAMLSCAPLGASTPLAHGQASPLWEFFHAPYRVALG